MKKIVFSIFIIITLITNLNQIVYANMVIYDEPIGPKKEEGLSFIEEAFSATKNFLNEDVNDEDGRISTVFELIKKIIKVINRILLIALAGISMISLAVIGIKYIMSSSTAGRMTQAKNELKTVVIGMAFGFGAYTIWMIGISVIEMIVGTLS